MFYKLDFQPHILFVYFLIFLLSLSGCIQDEPINEPINQPGGGFDGECTEAILYNVKKTENFSIAVRIDEEETILVEDPNFDFWWARLSPNKTTFLCYKSPIGDNRPDNDYSRAELWRFSVDGTNGVKLIDLDDYGWLEQGVADWSPDGNYLVMAAVIIEDPSKPEDFYWHLFRTNADGSNPIQLTSGPGLRGDPSWSPNGDKIIYVSFPEDYDEENLIQLLLDISFQTPLEVHIADISQEGKLSNIIQLTDDDIRDNDPYMSPDGKIIAWESFVDSGGAIRQYDLDAQLTTTILEPEEFVCCPSWNEESDRFLIHAIGAGSPFYIAEYNILTQEYRPILKVQNAAHINPQWVCWPN